MSQNGTPAAVAEEVYYPDSDGKPMAETQQHLRLMLQLVFMLDVFFRDREDVNVGGNQYLYYEEENSKKFTAPDVYVLKGVSKLPPRKSIKTWVEKTVPCFVMELTSKSTAQEDQEEKKQIYLDIGVPEYFLFDPWNEYLPQQLMGYRLMAGKYDPLIPSADGGLVSNQLQLRFVPDGINLKVFDFRTGERLKAADEYRELAEQAEEDRRLAELRLQEEQRQREEEKRRREEENRQRQQAEQRLAELTAELERLRAQLQPPRPTTNGSEPPAP